MQRTTGREAILTKMAGQFGRRIQRALRAILGASSPQPKHVEFFAWSLADLSGEARANLLCQLLREYLATLPVRIRALHDAEVFPLDSYSCRTFRNGMIRSKRQPSAVIFNDQRDTAMVTIESAGHGEHVFFRIWGAIEDRFFEESSFAASFRDFLQKLSSRCEAEYLVSSHGADVAAKRALPSRLTRLQNQGLLGNVPPYHAKPARSVPYLGWLLILGPRYAGLADTLNPSPAGIEGDTFSVTLSENPLSFENDSFKEEETQLRSRLEPMLFDPNNPFRVAKGPEYPSSLKVFSEKMERLLLSEGGTAIEATIRNGKLVVEESGSTGNGDVET